MLEHLIHGEFHPDVVDRTSAQVTPFEKAEPATIIDAKVKTADWLKDLELDDDEIETKAEQEAARKSFASLVTGQPVANTQQALANVKTPAAVQHLVGMLTAYDWAFVEQARELRGYAVAQILEEVKHPDAKVRLKALQMLGNVTEVALFTERVEVKKTEMSDVELESRIKEKLNRFMGVIDVVDINDEDASTKTQKNDTLAGHVDDSGIKDEA
jgi:HEAT repeat protein